MPSDPPRDAEPKRVEPPRSSRLTTSTRTCYLCSAAEHWHEDFLPGPVRVDRCNGKCGIPQTVPGPRQFLRIWTRVLFASHAVRHQAGMIRKPNKCGAVQLWVEGIAHPVLSMTTQATRTIQNESNRMMPANDGRWRRCSVTGEAGTIA